MLIQQCSNDKLCSYEEKRALRNNIHKEPFGVKVKGFFISKQNMQPIEVGS